MIGLVDLEVVSREAPVVPDARAAEGVGEGAGDVEPGDVVPEAPVPRFGQALVPLAGVGRAVVALPVLPELAEDLIEGRPPECPLGLGGNLDLAGLLVLREVPALLELVDEVLDRLVGALGQVVFVVELPEPVERLLGVAGRVLEQVLEEVKQLLEQGLLAAVALGIPFGIA